MTQELFPKADRVMINLIDESVTVPDGKVWVISIVTDGLDAVTIDNPDGNSRGRLSADDDRMDSSISRMTLHEGMILSAQDTCHITGWQFEYGDE